MRRLNATRNPLGDTERNGTAAAAAKLEGEGRDDCPSGGRGRGAVVVHQWVMDDGAKWMAK